MVPAAFHGGHLRMPWGGVKLTPGPLRVRFGAPIPVDGLVEEDARDLADRAQVAVTALYEALGRVD